MSAPKALIVWGGWEGHEPREVARLFEHVLGEEGFDVSVSDSLASFEDQTLLKSLALIVPVWTMGSISDVQCKSVCAAVESGIGIAGCHGGMCDSFRTSTEWHFMTGGQWVAHPGNDGVEYMVHIVDARHAITQGISDYLIRTQQYYMHVDPGVSVLANTRFPIADGPHAGNGRVDMPVVWVKLYGQGRVYYNSIGHRASTLASEPTLSLIRRGFRWAAGV